VDADWQVQVDGVECVGKWAIEIIRARESSGPDKAFHKQRQVAPALIGLRRGRENYCIHAAEVMQIQNCGSSDQG
jgi:hypothetical protein